MMTFRMKKMILLVVAISFVFTVVAAMTGCSTIQQRRMGKVPQSGFLKDYSKLEKGKSGEALMVYINPDANFAAYDKMIIDPVSIIITEDSDMANIAPDERQKMADYMYLKLKEELGSGIKIVNTPGPTTIRLRFALTDMKSSNVVMDTISTALPIGLGIDIIAFAATGDHINVGNANGEIELLDSWTQTRLAAALDGQSGAKVTGKFDKWSKWDDTRDACDFWVERIRDRLQQLKAKVSY